jgi:hypothetical protein
MSTLYGVWFWQAVQKQFYLQCPKFAILRGGKILFEGLVPLKFSHGLIVVDALTPSVA